MPTPTFFHECCHFIQDITTSVGLFNIITNLSILQDVVSQAQNMEPIKIPIDIPTKAACENFKNQSKMFGDKKNVQQVSVQTIKPNNQLHPDCTYKITDINQNDISVGILGIIESMSNSLEETIGSSTSSSPDYPYHICEKTIIHIHNVRPEIVLALCDASLMYSNPSYVFFTTLKEMKRNYLSACSMHEVYDFIFNNFHCDKGKSFIPLFENSYKKAVSCLNNILGNDNCLEKEKEWILSLLESGYKLRRENPTFWADMLNDDSKENRKNNVIELLNMIGFPILFDKKNQIWISNKITEEVDYSLFPSLFAINEVLCCGKKNVFYMKIVCKTQI